MVDPLVLYEAVKFWLPLMTIGTLLVKAYLTTKKNIGGWAEKLLSNHLSHIQKATETTVAETKITNELLIQHTEKEMSVWAGVVNTLAVLEDRTRRSRTPSRTRRKK